jgi:HD-GYP domain-containing protein (c-di-GMP phosphodiesterase class II)
LQIRCECDTRPATFKRRSREADHPDGLVGQTIPLGARIVSACDAWDAMITTRPYRRALSTADALQELRRCSGTQFDPVVVRALCAEVDSARELPQTTTAAA